MGNKISCALATPLTVRRSGREEKRRNPRILVESPWPRRLGLGRQGGAAPCVVTLCEHALWGRSALTEALGGRTMGATRGSQLYFRRAAGTHRPRAFIATSAGFWEPFPRPGTHPPGCTSTSDPTLAARVPPDAQPSLSSA